VNFKSMESRLQPGLFLAGEVLDVDGITGGYNFQSAWTTGFIAGQHCAASLGDKDGDGEH
jgi:predicted flavoprotein YhiN